MFRLRCVVICFQKRIFDILINNNCLEMTTDGRVVICFQKRIFDILINNTICVFYCVIECYMDF